MRRRSLSLIAVSAAAAVLASASTASAHVTVNPNNATQGGFAKLTFRVPTERDVATTKLEVAFPADQPLAFFNVKPHAGWSYKVTKAKLATPITVFGEKLTEAVSRVTWTAEGAANAIKPGEFDEFDVSVGPLPTAPQMVFKALQTYADGQVVRWIEPRAAGAADPEHPAPVLTLTAAAPADSASASPTATASAEPSETGTGLSVNGSNDTGDDDSDAAGARSWVALGLGALALIVALISVATRRRQPGVRTAAE
jgi:uncharacterized protein YcnI